MIKIIQGDLPMNASSDFEIVEIIMIKTLQQHQ
jgi:hypothetical protein